MVVPKVSPEQTCMLGKFQDVLKGQSTLKDTNITGSSRGSSLPTPQPNSVKQISSEPLQPEQPRVVIPYSQFCSLYLVLLTLNPHNSEGATYLEMGAFSVAC